jgi:transcriptional regulator with XRE-family HTH domain
MDSIGIGRLLRQARDEAGLSRADLAARCGVGVRLLAELERGERPHVSLETAIRLLTTVGIRATLEAPGGDVWHAEDAEAAAAPRAAHRRRTWSGRIARRDDADAVALDSSSDLAEGLSRTARLSADLAMLVPTA